MKVRDLLPVVALVLAACGSSPTSPGGDRLAVGGWGGSGIQMQVGTDSSHLEFDCAHATIDEPFTLDGGGRFNLAGRFTFERGGPISEEGLPSRPARYRGTVEGNRLDLTITLVAPEETLGTFMMTRGRIGRVIKCL